MTWILNCVSLQWCVCMRARVCVMGVYDGCAVMMGVHVCVGGCGDNDYV